jgi:hypothetical protein
MPGFPGQLTATDDQGDRYHLRLMRGTRTGVLELFPAPARPIAWLELLTASGGRAAHLDLGASRRPVPQPQVTPADTSPGELMLDVIAARILAAAPAGPPDRGAPRRPPADLRAFVGDRPGALTTALLEAGALPAESPLPGQLAALCERLGLAGHGITAPPAAALPARWESMLGYRGGPRMSLAPGTWATAVTEPELGGIRLTILGLQQGAVDTTLHTLVTGAVPDDDWDFGTGIRPLRAIWVRDSSGDWHATRTIGVLPWSEADVVMHSLAIVPALPAGTAWIDVLSLAPQAQAQVRLPLAGR